MLSRGFTFLEVLVSLALISIVSLNLVLLSFSTIHYNSHNYYFNVAQQQLTNMAERLDMIGSNVDLTEEQLTIWNQENYSSLPCGIGILTGHFPEYKLKVCWREGFISQLFKKNMQCVTL